MILGFWRLLFLLTLVPLVELILLLEVGRNIGTWPTVGIVLFTGIVGAIFASREEAAAIRLIRSDVFEGRVPSHSLLNAGIVLAGGLLLITPGLLTDALGFSCLIGPSRRVIHDWLVRKLGNYIYTRF